jgi:hypothetical protein
MRTRIAESLPPLQERAKETNRLMIELLTGQKKQSALAKAA